MHRKRKGEQEREQVVTDPAKAAPADVMRDAKARLSRATQAGRARTGGVGPRRPVGPGCAKFSTNSGPRPTTL